MLFLSKHKNSVGQLISPSPFTPPFLDDSCIHPESVLYILKQFKLSQPIQEGHLIICIILLSSFVLILILFQPAFILGDWDYT